MQKHILTNCQVHTFNSNQLPADTVLIEDGIISAVGKADEIISLAGEGEVVTDLCNSILMPSFTDSHIHLLLYGLSLHQVDAETFSRQECLDRVKEKVNVTPPGKCIRGHGWNHNIWEGGYGSKEDLDNISQQHPIYLTHKSLHSGWANSAALAIAGIERHTLDPEGGSIQRDDTGEPTGILLESAMALVESAIPAPDKDDRQTAILKAQNVLNRFGITAIHDFDPWVVYKIMQDLQADGKLTLRVTKGIPASYLENAIRKGLRSGQGDDWLKIGWLKLFADGALGPQTAAMLDPYEKSQSKGMLLLTKEELVDWGKKALSNHIGLAIHAIGDRANREALLAFSDLENKNLLDFSGLRSRIEHVQLISEEDIRFFPNLKIIASMQPIHAISDIEMADLHWGSRCANSYAWRKVVKSGADLIFGSDAPVESPNPFYGLYAATTRKQLGAPDFTQESWYPDQCLGLNEALSAFISKPASMGGFSGKLGNIAEGYLADLILLPDNLFEIPQNEIQSTLPLATMVNGSWVYKNDKIDIEFN